MSGPEPPEKVGQPRKIDTVEEPCFGCGVVQEMEVWAQDYDGMRESHYPKGECPVCGNDHQANTPW